MVSQVSYISVAKWSALVMARCCLLCCKVLLNDSRVEFFTTCTTLARCEMCMEEYARQSTTLFVVY